MIRFISEDGTGITMKVLNAKTGEDISKTLAISYGGQIVMDQLIKASVEICMMSFDITAHETVWHTKHPVTGEYGPLAALVFRDGTKVEFDERGVPKVTPASEEA